MIESTLVVRRTIAAAPERLFAAWTEPAHLRAWWGPPGVTCEAAEVDLRPGGAYRLANRLPDGKVLWIAGTFEEIDPPRRLVYSWQLGDEPASRVTVQFVPAGAATEVIVTHERIATPAAHESHEQGWLGCLAELASWVASGA